MFAAKAEERIFLESRGRLGDARRRAISVALVVAIYALSGATLVFEDGFGEAPKESTEIPVEIVVEPPPPPPAAPPPPPPAEAPPPPEADLTPARDAPRAGTAEADTGDKDKPNPPPAPAAEDKTAERASGAEAQAEAPKPEASPAPDPTPTPAEPAPPLEVAKGEVAPPAPLSPATEPPSPTKPAPAAGKSAPRSAPLFASVPDMDFGSAMKAPVSGGNARANYFSILYGMIMPHFRRPHGGGSLGRKYGALVFTVDRQGRLMTRYIAEESGLPELDRAAMEAIAAASPFPPPPAGLANGSFRWSFGVE